MSSFIVLLFNFIPNPNQGQDTLGKTDHSFAGFANIVLNFGLALIRRLCFYCKGMRRRRLRIGDIFSTLQIRMERLSFRRQRSLRFVRWEPEPTEMLPYRTVGGGSLYRTCCGYVQGDHSG